MGTLACVGHLETFTGCSGTQSSASRYSSPNNVQTDAKSKAVSTTRVIRWLEGRKEMFYLTTHSTHFTYGYMASGIIMVKDRLGDERGKPPPPLHGLIFPMSSNYLFIIYFILFYFIFILLFCYYYFFIFIFICCCYLIKRHGDKYISSRLLFCFNISLPLNPL